MPIRRRVVRVTVVHPLLKYSPASSKNEIGLYVACGQVKQTHPCKKKSINSEGEGEGGMIW